jgi:hypothetical protein
MVALPTCYMHALGPPGPLAKTGVCDRGRLRGSGPMLSISPQILSN